MNFFNNLRNREPEGQRLGSDIPGAFPDMDEDSQPQHTSNMSTTTDELEDENPRSLGFLVILLRIPLYLLFYFTSLILVIISFLKPIINFNKIYHKHNNQYEDHVTEITTLLEQISNESYSSSNRSLSMPTFTFGSLYNSEAGGIPRHLIQTSYLNLLDNCSSQFKFGLIYLHDPLVPRRMSYVNDILCSERFVNCVKTYQMLLWFSDVTTSEGLQVANALKVRKFPYIGILAKKTTDTAEVIFGFNGPIEEYNPKKLESILVKKYPTLLQMIEENRNAQVDRNIREQQDERFRASLRRDQERERIHNEAIEREHRTLERERLHKQWLLWRRNRLQPEPQRIEGVDVSKVAIRLHDNTRIIRNFSPSLPIEEVYAFVELTQTGLIDSDEQCDTPPEGYSHQYMFRLFVPAPRKELAQETLIGEEPGIYPSGNIIVEEEEEWI